MKSMLIMAIYGGYGYFFAVDVNEEDITEKFCKDFLTPSILQEVKERKLRKIKKIQYRCQDLNFSYDEEIKEV